MKPSYVRCDVADGVAVVTLDNPPVNSLSMEAYAQITDVFDDLTEREGEVRVAILTGAGDRGFSAGRDVKDAAVTSPRKRARFGREMFWSVLECEVPVIGAINGFALGAGFGLAAVCDMLIASETAVFGMPEVDVGALGGYKFLARIMPEQMARQFFFTARRFDAREAYRLGFVSQVVPKDQLMPEAMKLAREIAAKSPVTIRMAKKAIITSEFLPMKQGYRIEQNFTIALSKTEDAREAAQAFVEKRKPVWKGR